MKWETTKAMWKNVLCARHKNNGEPPSIRKMETNSSVVILCRTHWCWERESVCSFFVAFAVQWHGFRSFNGARCACVCVCVSERPTSPFAHTTYTETVPFVVRTNEWKSFSICPGWNKANDVPEIQIACIRRRMLSELTLDGTWKWTKRKEEMWIASFAHTAKRSRFWLLKVGKMAERTNENSKWHTRSEIAVICIFTSSFLLVRFGKRSLQKKPLKEEGKWIEINASKECNFLVFFLRRNDASNWRSIRAKLNVRNEQRGAQHKLNK